MAGAQTPSPVLPSAPSFVDIGFGPTSLAPAQQGAPIFTVNDSLWVYSTYNEALAVSLVNPDGVAYKTTLYPSSILSLHTFSISDPQGRWTLYFALPNSTYYSIPISLVDAPQDLSPVSLSEYSIQNGEINMGFSVNSVNSYDVEGCLTSNSTAYGNVSLSEPVNVGAGDVSLSIDAANNTALVATIGTVNSPFSFWFDLEYSYSYTTLVANESISRDVLVARSSTILFNSSSSETVSLPVLSNLRTGRYEIQGYFDSGSGFDAAEAQALYMNGNNWFSLSACDPFTVSGDAFTKQVSLTESPSTWPSVLYFMYQYQGIEGYTVLPLQINLARLDFLGSPDNVQLSDFSYSISNNSDVEATGTFSGSIYVIAKSFPLNLTVTPMFGFEALSPIQVQIPQAFSDSQYLIPVGKLTVEVLNNSAPDAGADVAVSSQEGANLSAVIPAGGNTSFYLPAGFYNIGVSKDGSSELGNATVVDGSDTIVTVTVTTGEVPKSYLELLLVPLVLGLALNVWAWVVSPRKNRYLIREK